MKSGLQVGLEYDELLKLSFHFDLQLIRDMFPDMDKEEFNKCVKLKNKLDDAITDFEEINHLNNIAILNDMYEG